MAVPILGRRRERRQAEIAAAVEAGVEKAMSPAMAQAAAQSQASGLGLPGSRHPGAPAALRVYLGRGLAPPHALSSGPCI